MNSMTKNLGDSKKEKIDSYEGWILLRTRSQRIILRLPQIGSIHEKALQKKKRHRLGKNIILEFMLPSHEGDIQKLRYNTQKSQQHFKRKGRCTNLAQWLVKTQKEKKKRKLKIYFHLLQLNSHIEFTDYHNSRNKYNQWRGLGSRFHWKEPIRPCSVNSLAASTIKLWNRKKKTGAREDALWYILRRKSAVKF